MWEATALAQVWIGDERNKKGSRIHVKKLSGGSGRLECREMRSSQEILVTRYVH